MANLAAGIDSDDTTVTLDAAVTVPGYRAGLTIGTEKMYVRSWTSTTVAQVSRGSGAAAHAMGAAVAIGYWSPAETGSGGGAVAIADVTGLTAALANKIDLA